MSKIGSKVKIAREKANLTEAQMASFLEISTDKFAKCESGEEEFTVDCLEKICDLFGFSIVDLLNEAEPIRKLYFAASYNNLNAVADINRITLNIREMRMLLDR